MNAVRRGHVGGVTLFRSLNVDSPAQIRELTERLQATARQAGRPPLLIAVDQEGGQLMALGDATTPFPGNMALGATRSAELARRVGFAIGRELAALGVNVNYAPVADVNLNPHNPVIGTRAFGEAPDLVATLSAALGRGLQAAGVAATAKHFPGHGDTAGDSHHGTPVVTHDMETLRRIDLPPFQAAIEAGVRLILTAHVAVPALDDQPDRPATLSARILRGVLRNELKFEGVIVTDALDMRAISQGAELYVDAICAALAGADVLLLTSFLDQPGIYATLLQAARRGLLPMTELEASAARIATLKQWLAAQPAPPSFDVVGCAAHHTLAAEVARQSITLVRDDARLLPIRLPPDAQLAVIVPRPIDLTPADTSSYVAPTLAQAARAFHARVNDLIAPHDPSASDIAAICDQVRDCDLILIGTLNAYSTAGQAALVNEVLRLGVPVVVAALRLPYDLTVFPAAPTYVCTYSVLQPSMRALAQALWGEAPFRGRLPVTIPDLYPRDHGLIG